MLLRFYCICVLRKVNSNDCIKFWLSNINEKYLCFICYAASWHFIDPSNVIIHHSRKRSISLCKNTFFHNLWLATLARLQFGTSNQIWLEMALRLEISLIIAHADLHWINGWIFGLDGASLINITHHLGQKLICHCYQLSSVLWLHKDLVKLKWHEVYLVWYKMWLLDFKFYTLKDITFSAVLLYPIFCLVQKCYGIVSVLSN